MVHKLVRGNPTDPKVIGTERETATGTVLCSDTASTLGEENTAATGTARCDAVTKVLETDIDVLGSTVRVPVTAKVLGALRMVLGRSVCVAVLVKALATENVAVAVWVVTPEAIRTRLMWFGKDRPRRAIRLLFDHQVGNDVYPSRCGQPDALHRRDGMEDFSSQGPLIKKSNRRRNPP